MLNTIYTTSEIFSRWKLMVNRCSGSVKGYEDCTLCEEWKNFNNFEKWFRENIYGTKDFKLEIDKDLFGNGKKIYSPDTCCLLPKSLNILLSSYKSKEKFMELLLPSKKAKYKFKIPGTQTMVYADSIDEAYEKYKECKKQKFKVRADAYSFLIPARIYDAIVNFEM